MIPSNLRVIKYLSGSVQIAWDGALLDNQHYIVEALNVNTSVWDVVSETLLSGTVVFGPYSAIRVAIVSDGATGTYSDILAISIMNAANIFPVSAIGQDESGQTRLLATTPEGVLKVTGATITNTGGDASAANQLSQISQLNTLNTSLNTTIASLSNILSKLSSVGLDNASIVALKSVDIDNLPTDYPDFALLAAVNNLNSVVAKAQNILDLIAVASTQLKTSDLSINGSKQLATTIENLPVDYPDASSQILLSDTILALGVANNNLDSINSVLSQIQGVEDLSYTALTHIEDFVNTNSQKLTDIFNKISQLFDLSQAVASDLAAVNLSNEDIAANTVGLLKTANLNIDANKDLGVKVNNLPGDYPDSAALVELGQIKNNLLLVNQGVTANISGPLPSGNNLIGNVNIATAPLPTNAATESTLSDVRALENSQLSTQNFIKEGVDYLNTKLSGIENKLTASLKLRTKILDELVNLAEVSSIRLLDYYDDVQPEELNNFANYEIIILSYATAFDAAIRYESSYHSQNFYHTIKTCNLNLASISTNSLTMPLQNISIKFTKAIPNQTNNADVARVIIYGRD